ncbi:MAG: hypothetical protein M0D57_08610 [Sphingobacteriales bacterium JAD_PAG50586_3]|nr:MAG: hypothetical protein M0D57_08610 [Sphingobacteriales bacterium JAD_PAG50586_3]
MASDELSPTIGNYVTPYKTFKSYNNDPGDDFVSFVASHTRRQVTHTTYDVARVDIIGFEQKNLRNRVSSITISDTYVDIQPPGETMCPTSTTMLPIIPTM